MLQYTRKEDSAKEAMHLAKAASIAHKEHKNTNLTDLLKPITRWTLFHHHWYLSSIWFFMVLTLRSQVSSWSYHLLVATVQQLPWNTTCQVHCISGWWLLGLVQYDQVHKRGDGHCMKAFGSHSGQHYLMWRNWVENLSNADVKKDVREDSVPAQRQAYIVLPSAPARLTVTHDFFSSFNGCIFNHFLRK